MRKASSSITPLVSLEVLLSVVCLFLGWFEFVLLRAVGKITFPQWGGLFEFLFALVPVALSLIGSFYLLNSLLSLAIAYGLLKKRIWTWNLARILAIIGILAGVFSLPYGIMSIIFCALILFYLSRKEVKIFLRKSELSDNDKQAGENLTIRQHPIYEELLHSYSHVYGKTGKWKLDSEIEDYVKKGLTQEEAILKLAKRNT